MGRVSRSIELDRLERRGGVRRECGAPIDKWGGKEEEQAQTDMNNERKHATASRSPSPQQRTPETPTALFSTDRHAPASPTLWRAHLSKRTQARYVRSHDADRSRGIQPRSRRAAGGRLGPRVDRTGLACDSASGYPRLIGDDAPLHATEHRQAHEEADGATEPPRVPTTQTQHQAAIQHGEHKQPPPAHRPAAGGASIDRRRGLPAGIVIQRGCRSPSLPLVDAPRHRSSARTAQQGAARDAGVPVDQGSWMVCFERIWAGVDRTRP